MKNLFLLILLTVTTFTFGQREIKDQSLILNNGTDRNVTIEFNLGLGAANPKYRYNVTADVWEFTHDGTTWQTMVGLAYTNTQLALKAPLASPALTGVPTAPTAAPGTSTTQLATTAFTTGAVTTLETAHDSRLDSVEADVADHETRIADIETDLPAHVSATAAHGATGAVVGTTNSQTLTNKTIDADDNTIADINSDDMKAGFIDADISSVSASDDTVPSAKAAKNYADTVSGTVNTALNAHITQSTGAHAGSAIANTPSGNLTSTTVQGALNELQNDVDTNTSNIATNTSALATKQDASTAATDAELGAHETDTTSVHGIADTANLVTLAGAQTLTNKTISGASIQSPSRLDVKKDTLANLTTYAATATEGQIVFATDTDEMFQIVANALVPVGSGGGSGGLDYLYSQSFEDFAVTDFSGWTGTYVIIDTSSALNGENSVYMQSQPGSSVYWDIDINTPVKFRNKSLTVAFEAMSGATDGNVTYLITDNLGATLASGQVDYDLLTPVQNFVTFDLPSTATSINVQVTAAAETGFDGTYIDDLEIYTTTFAENVATVQEPDTFIHITDFTASYGSTNTAIMRLDNGGVVRKSEGSGLIYASDSVNGASFTSTKNQTCRFNLVVDMSSSANVYAGFSLNAHQVSALSTTYASVPYANRFGGSLDAAAPGIVNTYAEIKLATGDVVRPHGNGVITAGSGWSIFTASCQESLRRVNVNTNQKVKIPTSEVRFTGTSSIGRGSSATFVVRFGETPLLRGDAFEINPLGADTVHGTHIRMKKAGKLTVTGNIYQNTAGASTYLTKNQATLTGNPTSSELLSRSYTQSGGQILPHAWSGNVVVGDIIRMVSDSALVTDFGNNLHLTFQETEVQVSVSNTLPKFTEEDRYLRGAGNAGQALTSGTTNIPWNAIEDTHGAWSGSVYTVQEAGIYDINASIVCTAANTRGVVMYVDGVYSKRISGVAVTSDVHAGAISEKFAAGQTISFRVEGNACTLLNSTAYHFLVIKKTGKSNVEAVDVTPFVNVPQIETQSYVAMLNASNVPTSIITADGSGLFKISNSGSFLRFTALKKITVTMNGAFTGTGTAPTSCGADVMVNGTSIGYQQNFIGSGGGNTQGCSAGGTVTLAKDQYIEWYGYIYSGGSMSTNRVSVTAIANSDTTLTPTESFSTDTASLAFASSSSYTLSTLGNAPIGTFITFSYAAGTNTRTQCTTAPTQTTSDMAANGILTYTRAYASASTCAQPAAYAINLGRGHKGLQLLLYKSAGKVTPMDTDFSFIPTNSEYGFGYKSYDEKNGTLLMDAGINFSGSTSTRAFVPNDISGVQTQGYLVVHASKSPALAGVAPAQQRFATVSHQVASGVSCGASTASAWLTRPLNTLSDPSGFVSLGTNQFTLQPGEYYIDFDAPAYNSGHNKTRLRNITDGSDALYGTAEYSSTTVQTRSAGSGSITITAAKTFELQHYFGAAAAGNGMGVDNSFGVTNVCSKVKITKVK